MVAMIDTARTIYFKNADGEVCPFRMNPVDAVLTVHRHPHEWSLDGKTFAPVPEGFVASEGKGGGLGRIRGASVRVD